MSLEPGNGLDWKQGVDTAPGEAADSAPADSLRSREARLRAVLRSLDDIVYEVDQNGRCLGAWTGSRRLFADSRRDLPLHRLEDYLPLQSPGSLREAFVRVVENGKSESVEYSLELNSRKHWFLARINRIPPHHPRINTYSILVREITPRKEVEIALLRSEEKFRLFVEGVKDYAIYALDTDGRIVSWNRGAERIKGYRASEIIGQHFSVFYPPGLRSEKPKRALEIAAREGRYEDEGWRLRKDGSRFWASVVMTAIRDESGELVGFGKVTRDLTERMLAQKALESSQEKLRDSERALRELSLHLLRSQDEERRRIGREIHDSLGQYLSVLKIRLESMNAPAECADDLQSCADLLDTCIREVRTVSYLLYPPMLEEMGLRSAVPWYLDGFSKRSGIKTSLEISDDFGRLSRDAELVLFRVLQECLTNVQRHAGSPTADVRIVRAKDVVTLEVADRGKGLPAAVLERGGQDWMGSLGVGLRGMSERLRQLGGALDISSNGHGTCVRATVPLQKLPSADAPEE